MGAWIETLTGCTRRHFCIVAPFMGAWIETSAFLRAASLSSVAPFMGAWIETIYGKSSTVQPKLLPLWEHGLKLKKRLICHLG